MPTRQVAIIRSNNRLAVGDNELLKGEREAKINSGESGNGGAKEGSKIIGSGGGNNDRKECSLVVVN